MTFDPNGILQSFNEQEQALMDQIRQLREQRENALREAREAYDKDKLKTISITVENVVNDYFGVALSSFNEQIVTAFRSINGRWYQDRTKLNFFPVSEYQNFLAMTAEKFPQVFINYKPDVKKQIEELANQPAWTIKLDTKNFRLVAGRGHTYSDIYNIPGLERFMDDTGAIKYYKAPLSEGYKLHKHFERLSQHKKIIWEDDALEFVIKQMERRNNIDKIGVAKDWPGIDVEFADTSVKLRPVQRVALAYMDATENRTLLAYQMGLGKTVIAIANALRNNYKTSLFIVPASLKANWSREIFRLTGVKPYVLIGTMPSEYDLLQLINNPPKYILTNYETISQPTEYDKEYKDEKGFLHKEHVKTFPWVAVINAYKPDFVVVDESHYIKNTDSNRSQAIRAIKAQRIVHMTGTPVLNRPGELWPMLTMIRPEEFPSEDVFLRQYTTERKYARNVDELRELLKPIMIRRKQSDVVDELPPLNRMTEYHELSPRALKLYNKVLDGIYEEMMEFEVKSRNYDPSMPTQQQQIAYILAKIMRLKQICAIDKVERTADMATELHLSSSEDKHNKVLIFSQFKAVAYAIHQRLGHESLCFVSKGKSDFVTADQNERDSLVQRFQNDDSIKYLVVTEKSAKEGHNITQAGHVIFNDLFWTPANHEQGEGRAYMRISDPHGINSYYIICDMGGDGIEEWIWELLKRKMEVINQTVEGVEGSRDVSVASELIQKMKETMWTRKRR